MKQSLCVLLLFAALQVFAQPCDFTLGSFQPDVATYAAIQKGYFQKEGLTNFCLDIVTSSTVGYNKVLNGTYNAIQASADNTVNRYAVISPRVNVTIAAASDGGTINALLANKQFDTLGDLAARCPVVYAADGPTGGLLLYAYEMYRLAGGDVACIQNVSGLDNDQRLAYVNNGSADFAILSNQWAIEDYWGPIYTNVTNLGLISDFIWPTQGRAFSVRADAQDNPQQLDKLRRFFRGMLKGYKYVTKHSNKKKVIRMIQDNVGLTKAVSQQFYSIYIDGIKDLTGFNKFWVPSRRGMFNTIATRYNTGFGPGPATINLFPGPGNLVDLRALSLAMDDLDLGDAVDCYWSNYDEC